MRLSKNLVPAILAIVLAICLCPAMALASDDAASLRSGNLLTTQAVGNYGVDLASAGYQTTVNPYFAYRGNTTDGSGGECTWYAWGRAYEKLNVGLPGPGDGRAWHAKYWTSNCAAYGYPTGDEALTNSIMVEDDGSEYGHVYFVERVENGYAYVTEGNYLGKYNEDAINLSTKVRDSWPGHTLGTLSYIYLIQDNPMEVSSSEMSVSENKLAGKAVTCSPITVKDARGSVSFEKVSGSSALAVDPNTGAVTVKKGTTGYVSHTARVNVHAAGGDGYKPKDTPVDITVIVVKHPNAPVIKKLTGVEEGFEVKWKTATTATGYELMYSTSGSLKNAKTITYDSVIVNGNRTVTGLKGGNVYHLAMRSFILSNGTKFYSKWSAPAMVKTKQSTKYKIAFKANGGKGTMKAQTVKRDKPTALSANKFTRSGYKFAGWNTKANGKGKAYKNKAKVKNLAAAGKTITLYAQWKKNASNASYWIKTQDYRFMIPKYWQGKVQWETTAYPYKNKWGDWDNCYKTDIYLKGHKGDSRYLLANVRSGVVTGFGSGFEPVVTKKMKRRTTSTSTTSSSSCPKTLPTSSGMRKRTRIGGHICRRA